MLVAINSYFLWLSGSIAQTAVPDLTQPQYLDRVATQLPNGLPSAIAIAIAVFALLAIGLSAGMALLNFSLRNYPPASNVVVGDWMMRSDRLLQGLQQTFVVAVILLVGLGFCSTLANRQSGWEQSRFAQKTPEIAATDLVQQAAPQLSYTAQEPYSYTTELGGKLVKVQDKRDVSRQTAVNGSNIQVTIAPNKANSSDRRNFLIDFRGDYQITNAVDPSGRFVFQAVPPTGYSLLQNFSVEQNGKKLTSSSPSEYRYSLAIPPNSTSKIRVSYRAQGSPQWVYSAKDGSLANFLMTISTQVPRSNFVSGVVPTKTTRTGDRQIFTWSFNQNASAREPFGVGISTSPTAAPTGTLPLLLLLAPGVLLWWLLLLCLSIPMRLQDLTIAGFGFLAGIFALTYFSRLTDPLYVWSGISIGLLLLVWGLGRNNWRAGLAAIICTIGGAIIPIFGFLLGSRGVILSVAALLSLLWLAIRNWYGWYELEPRRNRVENLDLRDRTPAEDNLTRHDLLEESAKYNQLNPAAPTPEEVAKQLRDRGATNE